MICIIRYNFYCKQEEEPIKQEEEQNKNQLRSQIIALNASSSRQDVRREKVSIVLMIVGLRTSHFSVTAAQKGRITASHQEHIGCR